MTEYVPTICPSILASSEAEYKDQIEKVAGFAHRLHIDITDGKFAPTQTVPPGQAWWPAGVKADFHLMLKDPLMATKTIVKHKPHLVIIHAEAEGDFKAFADFCHDRRVKVGVALLPRTSPQAIAPALPLIDHVLIFSGDLGKFGGHANTSLTGKIHYLKKHKADLEIGWDGGINTQNISVLASAGVDVFNVGSFIQKADNPEKAYNDLYRIADETGTT